MFFLQARKGLFKSKQYHKRIVAKETINNNSLGKA